MQDESILFEQGLAFASAGQLPEAREALREVYRLNPARTEAVRELARLEREQGRLEIARELLADAVQRNPGDSLILLELGCLFHQTAQYPYALQYYRQTLQTKPDLAEGWHQLGRLFKDLERPQQAQEAFEHALALDPGYASCWNSLGLLHYFAGKAEPARSALQKAAELRPDRGDYHHNLGMAWMLEPVDTDAALEAFRIALRLSPEYGVEMLRIGDHFMHRGMHFLAGPFYQCALEGHVDKFETNLKLAQCAERECEMHLALGFYRKALELRPDQWLIQIRAALLLPLMYQSPEDVMDWRRRFAENLEQLHDMLQREKLPRAIQTLNLYSPAFLLAYQGIDNSQLLARLSDLWQKLFWMPACEREKPRPRKRRIGFVSAFFFEHSISGCYLGLVRELVKRGHEVFCFSIGQRKVDHVTTELSELTQFQVLATDHSLQRLAEKLIAKDLDMVIYPEIGLDPLTYFLAHARLAPVQIQLFGHAVTSGIGQMDYFVSGAPFELDGAQAQYREALVQLPRSPFLVSRYPMPEQLASREELGLPEGRIYLISGILFKLHPNMDAIFAEILKRDPEGQLVLIQPAVHQWHDRLWNRFETTLAPYLERVHYLPWMPRQQFFSLLLQADAALDTLHFGAGNVAYQALSLGVPLVTLPGSFLRSRTTFGLYEMMGMRDLVADTHEEYIELALRLANDAEWRAEMRAKVLERSQVLFDDEAIMSELADFVETAPAR